MQKSAVKTLDKIFILGEMSTNHICTIPNYMEKNLKKKNYLNYKFGFGSSEEKQPNANLKEKKKFFQISFVFSEGL